MRHNGWLFRTCTRAVVAGGIASLLFLACDVVEPTPVEPYKLEVGGLTATYDPVNDAVLLTWGRPAGSFHFYRIYRTTVVDSQGNPDTTTLEATLERAWVHPSLTSFSDIPSASDGVHYYGIRAVRVEPTGDTTFGVLSPRDAGGNLSLAACTVGEDVRFYINNRDEYTLSNICTLFVDARVGVPASVRFTQVTGDSLGADTVATIPGDVDNQAAELITTGFYDPGGTGAQVIGRVNFDADDPHNALRTLVPVNAGVNRFAWTLLPGSGQKNVWAEISWANGSRDTVAAFIKPQPHKVELVFRHSEAVQKDTAEWIQPGNEILGRVKASFFYTSKLRFSVKVFGDSTIDSTFECWIMTGTRYEQCGSDDFRRKPWMMTLPQTRHLTGLGDRHNPDQVYTLNFDISTPEGRNTLDTIRIANRAISGIRDTTGYEVGRNCLDSLTDNARREFAKKQFILVVRFRERFFGGNFTIVYGYDGNDELLRCYRDVYLPVVAINNSVQNEYSIWEGDTVSQPFSFALDSLSVFDSGYADIESIELLIARLPQGYEWHADMSSRGLSLDSVLSFSHFAYSYPLEESNYFATEVQWDNIDPREWSTGHHLMGVVVSDNKGNREFGYCVEGTAARHNPWRVYISSNY
jgi:hypothetical protein